MKTKEEIAQWVIDNRYPKSEFERTSDSEMYHQLIEYIGEIESKNAMNKDEEDFQKYLKSRNDNETFKR